MMANLDKLSKIIHYIYNNTNRVPQAYAFSMLKERGRQ